MIKTKKPKDKPRKSKVSMIETEAHAIDTGLGKSEYEKALHATPPHTCSVILYVEVGFTFI